MTQRARRRRRRNNKSRQKLVLLIGAAVLAVALIAFLIVFFVRKNAVEQIPAGTIGNNIYIEEINVSGMTAEKAEELLQAKISEYQAKKVMLVAEEAEVEVTLGDLGFQAKNLDELIGKAVAYGKEGSVWSRYSAMKELELNPEKYDLIYIVDAKTTSTVISEQLPELEGAAKDATIKRVNGQFVITEEQIGKKVDLEAAVKLIEEHFNTDWEPQGAERIELTTMVDDPTITKEQLKQVQDVLGTFTTKFVSGSDRGKNISNAAGRINGSLLMPGEQLSASDAMGERSAENGYLIAGAYLNGETIDSIGGGVCQVSSTLYNAALLAEMEIVERHPHSMTVTYVDPAMDAAIASGYKDLIIKNNTDAPMYIEGYTSGGKVTFTVYGKETRSDDRTVSYVSEVTSEVEPKKKFVAVSSGKFGKITRTVAPHNSIKSQLWKVVTENGVEVSKTSVNKSNYAASSGTWSVSVNTKNAKAKSVLTKAIATQDEAKIKAAITEAKAIIKAAEKEEATQETTTPDITTPESPTPGGGTVSP